MHAHCPFPDPFSRRTSVQWPLLLPPCHGVYLLNRYMPFGLTYINFDHEAQCNYVTPFGAESFLWTHFTTEKYILLYHGHEWELLLLCIQIDSVKFEM